MASDKNWRSNIERDLEYAGTLWLLENDKTWKPASKSYKGKEIPVGLTGDHETLFGVVDPSGHLDGRFDRSRQIDYERERDKQPHRKKDRHQNKEKRAAYMRGYRARKKEAK
jgi:hypothetical protein